MKGHHCMMLKKSYVKLMSFKLVAYFVLRFKLPMIYCCLGMKVPGDLFL